MLPFLKNKIRQDAGVIVKHREPDETSESLQPDSLESHVEHLLESFKSGNIKAIVEALRDVHDELHMEMSGDSNSYDDQNAKAVKYSKE